MTTLPQSAPARKPRAVKPAAGTCRWVLPLATDFGLLSIDGTLYAVCRLAAGGYRLMKPDGTTYDLDSAAEPWSCDCPDYQFHRHQKDPAGCKHVRALTAALAHLTKAVKIPAAKTAPADCPECGGHGATPADDSPAADPVRCPACDDRPRYRSPADQARNAPETLPEQGDAYEGADDPAWDETWELAEPPAA